MGEKFSNCIFIDTITEHKRRKQKLRYLKASECSDMTDNSTHTITCVQDSEALDMYYHHKKDGNKTNARHDQLVQFPVTNTL